MESKVLILILLSNIFLLTQAVGSGENLTIIAGTVVNRTSQQVVDDKPLVIYTQLQYYDQPSLKEYQECHENLEKCEEVCKGVANPSACVKECPVCPYLIKEKIVVQGVNDTYFPPVAVKAVNATNIIRLTNHIRNIIETHQGNITSRNENTVHVHQNNSRAGGQFGLGYNNSEPCCIVVRSAKNCEMRPNHCHHKRHRVCGKQCKSRVMMAKSITLCDKQAPNEDYSEANCYETVKYVPYQPHRKQNKCTYSPLWPYVLCGQNSQNYENSVCRRCLDLPYYQILQRGIPPQCSKCFMTYSSPIYSSPWHPAINPKIIDNGYLDSNVGGWHQDKRKCILPNGSISEDCQENDDTDLTYAAIDPWQNLPEAQNEYLEYNSEKTRHFVIEENPRKRRQTFVRSKYSRRYT